MEVPGFGPGPHAQGCRGLPVGVTVAGSAYIAEAPVERERTSVGLDVHARSVVACGIDDDTGELFRAPLVPDPEVILGWLGQLPPPVAMVYEAGPTGYGLARFLRTRHLRCLVAAPSKMQRPCGDRIKTDSRDALLLARLLRLGEIVEVAVPTLAQEAARDLVRAREDVRGDLMRARHRLFKLLLRQGIVYSDGKAWTGAHQEWLRRQHFDSPALTVAFDSALETVLLTADRRDRLDKAILELAADPLARPCATGGTWRPPPPGSAATRTTAGCTSAGSSSSSGASAAPSRMSRSPASWPAGAGRWPSWTDSSPPELLPRPGAGGSARSDPRFSYEPTIRSTLGPGHAAALLPNHRPAVTNPRISA